MKNAVKLLGFFSLIAVLGFGVLAGCEDDPGGSDPSLTGITANYEQEGTTIYASSGLDSLKSGLTVTASYSDSTTVTVTDYDLSGTLAEGPSTVTVTYLGKTATFTVTVSEEQGQDDITYSVSQIGGVDGLADTTGIQFAFSADIAGLNVVLADITVGGVAAKGSATFTKSSDNNWLLSPITVSSAGTANVKITKPGIEAGGKDFVVYKMGAIAPTLTGIAAVYTQGGATVYPNATLDSLKTNLTVTANYSDSTTATVTNYDLSGALTEGESTVTVTYFQETATFTVTVTAIPVEYWAITWQLDGGTAGGEYPTQVVKGGTLSKPADPTKAGHTFDDWYSDDAFTTVFNFPTAITQNTTVYAKFNIKTYTVTFITNGGSSISPITVNHGSLITESTEKEGASFVGWYTDSALTVAFNLNTPVTSNLTLYAKWETSELWQFEFLQPGGNGVATFDTIRAAATAAGIELPSNKELGKMFNGNWDDDELEWDKTGCLDVYTSSDTLELTFVEPGQYVPHIWESELAAPTAGGPHIAGQFRRFNILPEDNPNKIQFTGPASSNILIRIKKFK